MFEDKGRSAADQNTRLDRVASMVDRLAIPLDDGKTLNALGIAFRPSLAMGSPPAVDRSGGRLRVDG